MLYGDKKAFEIFGGSFPTNTILNQEGVVSFYSEGGSENKSIQIEKELERLINKE